MRSSVQCIIPGMFTGRPDHLCGVLANAYYLSSGILLEDHRTITVLLSLQHRYIFMCWCGGVSFVLRNQRRPLLGFTAKHGVRRIIVATQTKFT